MSQYGDINQHVSSYVEAVALLLERKTKYMFKPVRKKINEIDHSAAEALLQSNRRGILAMNGDNGYPYAIPINYF